MQWDKPAISQEGKGLRALLQADGEGCGLGREVATGHYEKTWPKGWMWNQTPSVATHREEGALGDLAS